MNTQRTVLKKIAKYSKIQEEVELASEKVELSIDQQLKEYEALARKLDADAQKLNSNFNKAENLLKQADKLLEPIGNYAETQIESAISDLEKAGLKNTPVYKDLKSSYDFLQRINASIRRVSGDISRALN